MSCAVLSLLLTGNIGWTHSVLKYRAELCTENVVSAGQVQTNDSTGSALVLFEPDEALGSRRLTYFITLNGLDLDGKQTPDIPGDDVRSVRIRTGGPAENGPHKLNIYGEADGNVREDDSNMFAAPSIGELSGVWTDDDETFTGENGERLPVDSVAISNAVPDLLAGRLYVEVTTARNPDGELRGQIEAVPSTMDLKYFDGAGFQFTFNVFSPRLIRIESSERFSAWNLVRNLVVTNTVIRSFDFDAAKRPKLFYRISELFLMHPKITVQPQIQQVSLGASVQFEVTAEGVPEPELQWLFDGEPIVGATNSVYEINSVQSHHLGSYEVVVSSVAGVEYSRRAFCYESARF